MGFFSKNSRNDIRYKFEHDYSRLLQLEFGASESEASQIARDLVEEVFLENQGIEEPKSSGDGLLGVEDTHPAIRKLLNTVRGEGATDTDIREWWNKSVLERQMEIKFLSWIQGGMFTQFLQEGSSPEEAAKHVFRLSIRYGDPNDIAHGQEDDRPLPHELRARFDRYFRRLEPSGLASFKTKCAKSSSMNAAIRDLIRQGVI
jgi:hypothetical protein